MIPTINFLGMPFTTTFKCELFLKLNCLKRLYEIYRGQYLEIEFFFKILSKQIPDHHL